MSHGHVPWPRYPTIGCLRRRSLLRTSFENLNAILDYVKGLLKSRRHASAMLAPLSDTPSLCCYRTEPDLKPRLTAAWLFCRSPFAKSSRLNLSEAVMSDTIPRLTVRFQELIRGRQFMPPSGCGRQQSVNVFHRRWTCATGCLSL